MSLTIHRSNATDVLATLLVEQLRASSSVDPMVENVVIVGSRGMERWLRHRVATALGICANINFAFPRAQILGLLAQALGKPAPLVDPWSGGALSLAVLGELAGEAPMAGPLASRHVGEGVPAGREAVHAALSVGDALDHLVFARPEWALRWSGVTAAVAPREEAVLARPEAAWQRELFGRLAERLGAGHLAQRVSELRASAPGLLAQGELFSAPPLPVALPLPVGAPGDGAGVPPPLHLFAVSALQPVLLGVLGQLARVREVHLYMPVASPGFLGEVRTRAELSRAEQRGQAPAEGSEHPVLSSLGRAARQQQALLEEVLPERHDSDAFIPPERLSGGELTLLQALQGDVFALRLPGSFDAAEAEARAATLGDGSVAGHACAGPTRQVEVLRDVLHGLFAADATLTPRDVVIMTPDVETYAPLVEAHFGVGRDAPMLDGDWGPSGAPRLPVVVADQSVRATNPVAEVMLRVLEVAGGRLGVASVLALAEAPLVRARFGLDAERLDGLRAMLQQAGVRWGADAAGRAAAGLPADAQNTWAFGLDRIALGAVMPEEEGAFFGALPLDWLEGQAVSEFGVLAQLWAAVQAASERLAAPRAIPAWCEALLQATDAMIRVDADQAWLREVVAGVLDQLRAEAEAVGCDVALDVGGVTALLSARLDASGKGDRPVTGAITLCALAPMRSVPFRVVCLLGMDEGSFPRSSQAPSWDLLSMAPRLGDRNLRDEDRHLLLEAILAARERLIVCWTGLDPVQGAERSPCAPVQELFEAIDQLVPAAEGRSSELLISRHALQPFLPAAFAGAARSYDRRMLLAAQRAGGAREAAPVPLAGLALTPGEQVWTPAELVQALRYPDRALVYKRLGMWLKPGDAALPEREPVSSAGEERWELRAAIVRGVEAALEAGAQALDEDGLIAQLRAQGLLPLGAMGPYSLAEMLEAGRAVLAVLNEADLSGQAGRAVVVDVARPGGRVLGAVTGLRGRTLVRVPSLTQVPTRAAQLDAYVTRVVAAVAGLPVDEALVLGVVKGTVSVKRVALPPDPEACLDAMFTLAATAARSPRTVPLRMALKLAAGEADVAAMEKAWKEPNDNFELAIWGDECPGIDVNLQVWPGLEELVAVAFGPLVGRGEE